MLVDYLLLCASAAGARFPAQSRSSQAACCVSSMFVLDARRSLRSSSTQPEGPLSSLLFSHGRLAALALVLCHLAASFFLFYRSVSFLCCVFFFLFAAHYYSFGSPYLWLVSKQLSTGANCFFFVDRPVTGAIPALILTVYVFFLSFESRAMPASSLATLQGLVVTPPRLKGYLPTTTAVVDKDFPRLVVLVTLVESSCCGSVVVGLSAARFLARKEISSSALTAFVETACFV